MHSGTLARRKQLVAQQATAQDSSKRPRKGSASMAVEPCSQVLAQPYNPSPVVLGWC